jgi:S-formylglutathione hydrolase FrmB
MSPNTITSTVRLWAIAALLLMCGGVPAQSVNPAPLPGRVVTVEFQSALVKTKLPYRVVLPTDYESPQNKNLTYPVLYLLHGLTGHYPDWTTRTRLAEYSARYRIIIVTPEGNNGWYTDSASSPSDKYESYIIEDLIPDVERRFRVKPTRDARAIAGLSMGGYGALKFAVKYPQKFVFAASFSGALGAASQTEETLRGFETILKTIEPVFGPPESPTRQANDIFKLYRELPAERIRSLPFLYLDCGTEDFVLPSNRAFHDLLLERKIPHEYRLLPGGHNWIYWDQQIAEVLRIAAVRMKLWSVVASAARRRLGPLTLSTTQIQSGVALRVAGWGPLTLSTTQIQSGVALRVAGLDR